MPAAKSETDAIEGLLDTDASMRPFLDTLKDGTTSKMNLSTVRSLALKTFSHPQIFCGFDQFKSCCLPLLLPQEEKNSDSAAGGPHSSLFNTLDLFSFGTLMDYNARENVGKDYFLPLNDQALGKLGQLTVLSCIQDACFNGKTSVSYDSLAKPLGLTGNIRAVEDVLIRCLYANVLKGKLCQKSRSFSWQGESLPVVLSRDVPSSRISDLIAALQSLGQRLEESQNDLAGTQHEVAQDLKETTDYWKFVHSQRKALLEESSSKGGGSKGPVGGGEGPPTVASRLFDAGRQRPGGRTGHGSIGGSDASRSSNVGRSSKRSRGGLAGKFVTDAAGYRM